MGLRCVDSGRLAPCRAGAQRADALPYRAGLHVPRVRGPEHVGQLQHYRSFSHFSGELLLDLDTPQNSRVDATAEAAIHSHRWDNANRMLQSSDYLDPANYPTVHFVSDRVEQLGPDHVVLHGHLTLRRDPPAGPRRAT